MRRLIVMRLVFWLGVVLQLGLDAPARAEELTPADERTLIVTRARVEVSRAVRYTGEWLPTSRYPMGDIASDRGACTDLVIRSLRIVGIDLQQRVHEDILAAPEAYGLATVDPAIDHRRVANELVFFQRSFRGRTTDVARRKAFLPGDVVFYRLPRPDGGSRLHVGIVSDRVGPRGLRLLLENGGPRAAETDNLDAGPIVGHFRVK